jgi:hypothetical protein
VCKHGVLNASFFVYGLFKKRNSEQVQWPYLHLKALSLSGLNMMLLSVCTVICRSDCSILNMVGECVFIIMEDMCVMCGRAYVGDVKFQAWVRGESVVPFSSTVHCKDCIVSRVDQ